MLDHVSQLLAASRKVSPSPNAVVRTADLEAAVAADLADQRTHVTRQEFSDLVLRAYIDHPDWRLGQTAYNTAIRWWPDVRDLALDKDNVDPFYEDGNIGRFMDLLFPDGEPREVKR